MEQGGRAYCVPILVASRRTKLGKLVSTINNDDSYSTSTDPFDVCNATSSASRSTLRPGRPSFSVTKPDRPSFLHCYLIASSANLPKLYCNMVTSS